MAADFKTAQQVEYYRKFLEQDVRPDGRELGEFRTTTLNIGAITTADGSSLVKLGNTTVVCGIKAELTKPKDDEPDKGFIVPNVELPPLCSARFKPGPPSEQAQVASLFLDETLKCSKCIDTQDLCIASGKWVWVLYCDLMCLNYDGSLIDACVTALIAALKNVRLPTVTLNEETEHPETDMTKGTGLQIQSHPVSTSFTIFDDHILMADPTDEEECLGSGVISIVTTEEGKVCIVHKPGGSSVSESKLQDCISRAQQRTKEVSQLTDETIHSIER